MADLCLHRNLDEAMERLFPPDQRRPNMMTLEPTRRCNFACGHCYCRLPATGPTPRPELSTEQWKDLITQAVDMGVLFALFTGGEPLLRADFRELWQYARQAGLISVLFTNGSLVDEAMADFLAQWTPRLVSISVYGASEGMYREVTGLAGMHERVLRGADLLRERGVMVEIKSMVTQTTLPEFEALREQSTRYQETFKWDAELTCAFPEGGGRPHEERLDPQTLIATELRDPVRTAEWRKRAEEWTPARPRPDSPFRCFVGTRDFDVDPYGLMHPCLGLEHVGLDLQQMTLAEAWEALPEAIAETVRAPHGPCQGCPLPPFCRACPADSLLGGTPIAEPVAWRCELAQLAAETFGVKARPPLPD